MSRNIPARHRATVNHSIVLEGLSHSTKAGAVALGRPAIIVAATGGLVAGVGAPAQAGTYAQEATTTATQAPVSAPAAEVSAASSASVHTVVSGDTMGGIAARYGVELNTLLAQNNLSYASIIYPGQQVTVSGAAAASTDAPVTAAPVAAAPAAIPEAAPANQVSYTVGSQQEARISLASSSITPAQQSAPAASSSGVGAALVASAYGQLGSIQDCTILVEVALRSIGLNVGDLGPTQFYQYGTVVGTPAPGDLVIRPGHIGIYVGNGEVISSGMNGANLTIKHPLSDLAGSSYVRVNG
ncbi:LysM peptidoglycan-binding domain-containing protein [uncultured Arthrobacter sp.]|uniref:LysM peptidoglycan-binding domain-containing protein n=1 Tax=uncultured Arthrobacter sp. TaxID=114050 RepID=UPI002616F274|nr:LysM peptidoglycan-binding domain-containing protein [uncultured Arthrobacter sp.]